MLTAENVGSDEAQSGVHPTVRRSPTLSERLWGGEWTHELTSSSDGRATIESSTFEEVRPFIQDHYPRIFGDAHGRFLVEEMTDAKRRFWAETDVYAFRSEGKTIGIAAGHPTDWSTYYVRTLALLPEYRELGVTTGFSRRLSAALRGAGVARLEFETSPANTAMVKLFSGDGYLVTGTVNSERWGGMLRFTKFLNEDADKAFRRQFIYVPTFGRDVPPSTIQPGEFP